MAHVLNDTYDSSPHVDEAPLLTHLDLDFLANGFVTGPGFRGQELVHDDDVLAFLVVRSSEETAVDQGRADGIEVAGPEDAAISLVGLCLRVLGGAKPVGRRPVRKV